MHVESYTIGFTASVPGASWTDAGFAVEKSVETGIYHQRDAKVRGSACGRKVGRTAYQVHNIDVEPVQRCTTEGRAFHHAEPQQVQHWRRLAFTTNFVAISQPSMRTRLSQERPNRGNMKLMGWKVEWTKMLRC